MSPSSSSVSTVESSSNQSKRKLCECDGSEKIVWIERVQAEKSS